MLYILFFCGCRASEVNTLKRPDYFMDGGNWVLDFTVKGGKKNRLAIHTEATIAINRYLAAVHMARISRLTCSCAPNNRMGKAQLQHHRANVPALRQTSRATTGGNAAFCSGYLYH